MSQHLDVGRDADDPAPSLSDGSTDSTNGVTESDETASESRVEVEVNRRVLRNVLLTKGTLEKLARHDAAGLQAGFVAFRGGGAGIVLASIPPRGALGATPLQSGMRVTSISAGDSCTQIHTSRDMAEALLRCAARPDVPATVHGVMACSILQASTLPVASGPYRDTLDTDMPHVAYAAGRVTDARADGTTVTPLHPLLLDARRGTAPEEAASFDMYTHLQTLWAPGVHLAQGTLVWFRVCHDGGAGKPSPPGAAPAIVACCLHTRNPLKEETAPAVAFPTVNNLKERGLIEVFIGNPDATAAATTTTRPRAAPPAAAVPPPQAGMPWWAPATCGEGLLHEARAAAFATTSGVGFSAALRRRPRPSAEQRGTMFYTKNGERPIAFQKLVLQRVKSHARPGGSCLAMFIPQHRKTVRLPDDDKMASAIASRIATAAAHAGVAVEDNTQETPQSRIRIDVARYIPQGTMSELRAFVTRSAASRARDTVLDVVEAWELHNPELEHQFHQSEMELQAALGEIGGESHRVRAFHGTPECSVFPIMRYGFDPKRRSGQAHGAGEYFARDPFTSLCYTDTSRFLLVCDILLGTEAPKNTTRGDFHFEENSGIYVVNQRDGLVLCLPRYLIRVEASERAPPAQQGGRAGAAAAHAGEGEV